MMHRVFGMFVKTALLLVFVCMLATAKPAMALTTAFRQAVAESAASDADIAAFYQANKYKSIWTGKNGRDRARRQALLKALSEASTHGLPASRYNVNSLKEKMKSVRGGNARGALEVEISKLFLKYARDIQTGVLIPKRIDSAIVRQVPYRARTSYLVNLSKSNPNGFFKALAPKTPEYTALMKEKIRLERLLAKGGWGQKVPAKSAKPGQSGKTITILRNRLMAMGYLKRSASTSYDAAMKSAVQQFQLAHGLAADGVAGPGTIKEINKTVQERLQSIIVAMERERWFNKERGARHVLVNITDFTAKIIDNNKVSFQTRTVVGANKEDRPTPEFSDEMEFIVINPSWYVPRSIVTKEYLPALKKNRNAVRHIDITDSKGRTVSRSSINFSQYNEKTFPFAMRQPPSKGNALGLVKFIFPNPHNIYLHDTPSKNLFAREVRAFSHGCIRLADPFDFGYEILRKETANPKDLFHKKLNTGKEQRVDLKKHVPVHIIYRTAFSTPKGHMNYRRDIYGRDGRIWNALAREGVTLRAVGG